MTAKTIIITITILILITIAIYALIPTPEIQNAKHPTQTLPTDQNITQPTYNNTKLIAQSPIWRIFYNGSNTKSTTTH